MILEILHNSLADVLLKRKKVQLVRTNNSSIDVLATLVKTNIKPKEMRSIFNNSSVSILEMSFQTERSHNQVEEAINDLKNKGLIYNSTSISDNAYHISFKGVQTYLSSIDHDFSYYFEALDANVFKEMDIQFNRAEIILITFLIVKNALSESELFDWTILSDNQLDLYFSIVQEMDNRLEESVSFDSTLSKSVNKCIKWGASSKFKNFKGILSGTDHIKHIDIWLSPIQGRYALDITDQVKADFLMNRLFSNLESQAKIYDQRQNYRECLYNFMDDYEFDLELKSIELNPYIEASLNMDY